MVRFDLLNPSLVKKPPDAKSARLPRRFSGISARYKTGWAAL
jgi:hypothetical protein